MLSPLESWVQALFKITKPVSSSGWLTVSEQDRTGTPRGWEGQVGFPPWRPWPQAQEGTAGEGRPLLARRQGGQKSLPQEMLRVQMRAMWPCGCGGHHMKHMPCMPVVEAQSCFVPPPQSVYDSRHGPHYFYKTVQQYRPLCISSYVR